MLVLTGGPGTGKTTTVNAILQLLENQAERVALCAPTGRAAKRLSELTGAKASTIHRLLEVDYTGGVVSFIHNDKNLLKCDVVILDEMSMVDVKLFQSSALRRCGTAAASSWWATPTSCPAWARATFWGRWSAPGWCPPSA